MATSARTKRMMRERQALGSPNPDYFVVFNDDQLFEFHAYIIGPQDSLYHHKLLKLHITIPLEYPFKPPVVRFIQHCGARIHPNLYVDGKVCLSILGTWQGEPWAYSMTVDSVLITIRSLLDKEPYRHEPGKENNEEFNRFVHYHTWRWLLIDYYTYETNPVAQIWIAQHLRDNAKSIIADLTRQQYSDTSRLPFKSSYESFQHPPADYATLARDIEATIFNATEKLLLQPPEIATDPSSSHKRQSPSVAVEAEEERIASTGCEPPAKRRKAAVQKPVVIDLTD